MWIWCFFLILEHLNRQRLADISLLKGVIYLLLGVVQLLFGLARGWFRILMCVSDCISGISSIIRAFDLKYDPPEVQPRIELAVYHNIFFGDNDDPENTLGVDVHDHAIQGGWEEGVKQLMTKSKTWRQNITPEHRIIQQLEQEFRQAKLWTPRLQRVLDRINQSNARLDRANITELNLIAMVYDRIKSLPGTLARTGLENLALQLKDCVDPDNIIVCAVGRVTRIVQSLEGLTPEITLMSESYLKQYLECLVGQARQQIQEKLPKASREIFESGAKTPGQEAWLDQHFLPKVRDKVEAWVRRRIGNSKVPKGQLDQYLAPLLAAL
jgi:hypothetical protein